MTDLLPQRGTGVEIGIVDSSLLRLRNARGQFIRFDMEAEIALRDHMIKFGFALREAIIRVWHEGGHDKTGYSLSTLKIETGTMWVRAHMQGGAAYVETGTPPHIISITQNRPGIAFISGNSGFQSGPKALHWTGGKYGEGDHFAATVHHPGYKGDDFVRRAFEGSEIEANLSKVATETFSQFTGGPAALLRGVGR